MKMETGTPAFVTVNVSGIRYTLSKDIFSKLPPAERVELCNSSLQDFSKTEYFYYKNRDIFEKVLNYFAGSALHVPPTVCQKELTEDLFFWGIEDISISPCCYVNVKRQMNEITLVRDFIDYQGKTSQNISEKANRFMKWRCKLWNFLDFKQQTTACRVSLFRNPLLCRF